MVVGRRRCAYKGVFDKLTKRYRTCKRQVKGEASLRQRLCWQHFREQVPHGTLAEYNAGIMGSSRSSSGDSRLWARSVNSNNSVFGNRRSPSIVGSSRSSSGNSFVSARSQQSSSTSAKVASSKSGGSRPSVKKTSPLRLEWQERKLLGWRSPSPVIPMGWKSSRRASPILLGWKKETTPPVLGIGWSDRRLIEWRPPSAQKSSHKQRVHGVESGPKRAKTHNLRWSAASGRNLSFKSLRAPSPSKKYRRVSGVSSGPKRPHVQRSTWSGRRVNNSLLERIVRMILQKRRSPHFRANSLALVVLHNTPHNDAQWLQWGVNLICMLDTDAEEYENDLGWELSLADVQASYRQHVRKKGQGWHVPKHSDTLQELGAQKMFALTANFDDRRRSSSNYGPTPEYVKLYERDFPRSAHWMKS